MDMPCGCCLVNRQDTPNVAIRLCDTCGEPTCSRCLAAGTTCCRCDLAFRSWHTDARIGAPRHRPPLSH